MMLAPMHMFHESICAQCISACTICTRMHASHGCICMGLRGWQARPDSRRPPPLAPWTSRRPTQPPTLQLRERNCRRARPLLLVPRLCRRRRRSRLGSGSGRAARSPGWPLRRSQPEGGLARTPRRRRPQPGATAGAKARHACQTARRDSEAPEGGARARGAGRGPPE
eukprot:357292-Chlamydomonas_euryale.AAC.2